MANSKYDFHKEEEQSTDLRFNRGTYIIIRIDGHKFHEFSAEHKFHKPNDKRALDLMVESAKQVIKTYKGHIPLAYGHSDEFSFLIRSSSNLMNRRVFKITSMLPVIFATFYNSNWERFFGATSKIKYNAWFDARPKEYPNCNSVMDYFRWRQVDCHINNLYNTTLHALTGRYIRYELISDNLDLSKPIYDDGSGGEKQYNLKLTPIRSWLQDDSKFLSAKEATAKLSKTVSSDKHEIMFKEFKINYNNELEQFKKGTMVVDTQPRDDVSDSGPDSIKHFYRDFTKSSDFWNEIRYVFDDYVTC